MSRGIKEQRDFFSSYQNQVFYFYYLLKPHIVAKFINYSFNLKIYKFQKKFFKKNKRFLHYMQSL